MSKKDDPSEVKLDGDQPIKVPEFNPEDLEKDQKREYMYVQERILALQRTRQNQYGQNLDKMWEEADAAYIPHRLKTRQKKAVATDEDKGWRSTLVNLGAPDWQADFSQSNPYIKIQSALGIMVDQNPGVVMTAGSKQYVATTEIIKQLYQRSWEFARSKNQLKLFVFNLAKYGWAAGRTYPLRIERKVKQLVKYNTEEPEKSEYEEKTIVEYNDIMRENLDPRNVWIDDLAKPSTLRSVNDVCWRKVYDIDAFKEEFKGYKRTEMVRAGGNTQEVISVTSRGSENKKVENKRLVEVFFYENLQKDLYMVTAGANKVPIIIDPLPVSDQKGLKKLTVWQTYWNLRHTESPYGIGIYESIRYDQGMLDRIRNMTLDQLTLSIYKMFFYQGTQSLENTGDIKITPGVGKQVLDPKNLNWLTIPGPGQDSYLGMQMMRKDLDEASGLTDPLTGQVTGKTAFEIAQAKESGLKRLKNPLDNILEALGDEGHLTVALMQMLYSIPETYEMTDERLINDYIKEIGGDPELFERQSGEDESSESPDQEESEGEDTESGDEPKTRFVAKVYREFPMNLDRNGKGELIETEDTKFFRIKPDALKWEGFITIKPQSLLAPSKQVEKALDLEMFNILIPQMQFSAQERLQNLQTGQPAGIDDLTLGKTIKEILELYDKDPKDFFPDSWMKEGPPPSGPSPMQQLVTQMGGQAGSQGAPGGQGPQPVAPQQAQTAAPSVQPQVSPTPLPSQAPSTLPV